MFDVVRFRSFKCLADVTLELGQLTVLVGANASGKSSVLDGLGLLCELATVQQGEGQHTEHRAGQLFSVMGGLERLRTSGHEGPLRIEASATGSPALAVEAFPPLEGQPQHYAVEFASQGEPKRLELPSEAGAAYRFFEELGQAGFGAVVRLRLDLTRVAGFAADSAEPHAKSDGEGTAAVLAWLAEQRSPALGAIEADLQRVVPNTRRLIPKRSTQVVGRRASGIAQPVPVLGRVFELEMDSGAQIPADLLSEGTLLTIGLLTVLHQPPVPRLVLLDDFDRALHPKAQRQLVGCVKDMLARDPNLQFVCTTHSPYVLDLFEAEQVRVLRADSEGHTRARRLTEHPEWAAWKDAMKAGEFWSYVGEDWLDVPVAAE